MEGKYRTDVLLVAGSVVVRVGRAREHSTLDGAGAQRYVRGGGTVHIDPSRDQQVQRPHRSCSLMATLTAELQLLKGYDRLRHWKVRA